MKVKQIEILFNIYEEINKDKEIMEKAMDLLNPDNYNYFNYGNNILDKFLNIIKIEDERLANMLDHLIYEVNLWKNKLSWNTFNWKEIIKLKPHDYSIIVNWKEYILSNKEDCINFLVSEKYID